jgi:hypothetical protein
MPSPLSSFQANFQYYGYSCHQFMRVSRYIPQPCALPALAECACPLWLPYFSWMLASCCAVVGVVPHRWGIADEGTWRPAGVGMRALLRIISTMASALKRVSRYVCAGGMMLRRKLISRGRGVGPATTGVLPEGARLRRAASRRRPAAPLRAGDSPRASLRG